ncbi:hypothetical protein [Jeongeupia sp. USM3]|uniref:hypothetical protein n=1 Tax=Jeongeupia sp. USM3 TaxID=1906741 RepID=UPI00089DFA79|nr:hypothetical protein [Jeongeupia sp. USM3]AOY01155.1 hypothetical protein BJP62_12290 [Jeongeupia sp. USM3]
MSTLIGTWELVSGECMEGDKLHVYDAGLTSRKVINATHFSFISSQNGAFWAAGSGAYRVEGDLYTETPDIGSYVNGQVRDYVFRHRVDGDEWRNERWENGVRAELEIWRRVG